MSKLRGAYGQDMPGDAVDITMPQVQPGQRPGPSLTKRAGNVALSSFLSLLLFLSISALIALTIVRPSNIPEIMSNVDVAMLLEETGVGDEIIKAVNDTNLEGINVDMDSLRGFLQRSNVTEEIGLVVKRYLTAVANGDFDYYITSREIVSFLRSVSSDIYAEFGYRLTSEDYESIAESLDTDVNLKDYRIENLMNDAGINIAAPWALLSVYPMIVVILLCSLFILDIFLLHRGRTGSAFLIIGIVLAVAGFVYTAAGLLIGPFSGVFSGSRIYGAIKAASGLTGRALVSGLVLVGIGCLAVVAFFLLRKYRRKNPPQKPVMMYPKV